NTTKTGWDTDDPGWARLHDFMHDQMQPLVAFLNQLIEARPITREQRKRAERVRRQLQDALKRLEMTTALGGAGLTGEFDAPGGRQPPASQGGTTGDEPGRERGPVVNRTPPPTDPVGRLVRRYSSG